jgi:flagellar biosynthetic protein FlhB
MAEESGEKTEEPTPHKLREARKKGQVAKSKDLTAALMVLSSFFALKYFASHIWKNLTTIFYTSFDYFNINLLPTVAGFLLEKVLRLFLLSLGPLFFVNVLVAFLVESLQTGFVISSDPIQPDINKLNPIEGAKKFFSLKQYVELFKSVIKMALVIFIIWITISNELQYLLLTQQFPLWTSMTITGQIVMKIVVRLGLFYLFIGFLDYFYQRYEYLKGLKMSKKEIRDEYKRLEGDPMVKFRQREAQRQMAQGRQMGAVPGADVVVTNPIFIAIAIKYEANKMKAPKVVAKGKRLVAKDIRQLAEKYDIPIIENPPLARGLFDVTEVGSFIPPMYYKAIAEILAFVFNLKKKRRTR